MREKAANHARKARELEKGETKARCERVCERKGQIGLGRTLNPDEQPRKAEGRARARARASREAEKRREEKRGGSCCFNYPSPPPSGSH